MGYQSANTTLDGTFERIALRETATGIEWRTRSRYVAERAAPFEVHELR